MIGPAHLLAAGGEPTTLCGIKVGDRNSSADLPHLLARFLGRHQRGHGLTACPDCERIARSRGVALDFRPGSG